MNILGTSNHKPHRLGWAITPYRYLSQPIWFHPLEGVAFEDLQLGMLVGLPADVEEATRRSLAADPAE